MDRLFFVSGPSVFCDRRGVGVHRSRRRRFRAHALKGRVAADMLAVFEVGARYQMYHALALLACAWAIAKWPGALVSAAGWLFHLGHTAL
jgi:hypothetical protein